jgi:hypothetical protein
MYFGASTGLPMCGCLSTHREPRAPGLDTCTRLQLTKKEMEVELGTIMYLSTMKTLSGLAIGHDYETIMQHSAQAMAYTEDLVDHIFPTDIMYAMANEIINKFPVNTTESHRNPYEITYELCARVLEIHAEGGNDT